MILKIEMFDARKTRRGYVKMKWNLGLANEWSIVEDPQQLWPEVGYSTSGILQRMDSVISLYDWPPGHGLHVPLVFPTPPASESDEKNASGWARVSEAKNAELRGVEFHWEREVGLNELRTRALRVLDRITVAKVGSAQYTLNPFQSNPATRKPGYTTCVEFPAYYIQQLGSPRKLTPGFPPPSTVGWREDGGKPLPGDIYRVTGHVGVVYSTNWENSNGALWRTSDWGQESSGYYGMFLVQRCEQLEGKTPTLKIVDQTRPPRPLLGWVDIDVFCGT